MYSCVSMAACPIFILPTQTCWPTKQAEHTVEFPWQQCLNQQHYAQTVTRNRNSLASMLQKLRYIVDSDIYSSTYTKKCIVVFLWQQWSCKHVTMLSYIYTASCLVWDDRWCPIFQSRAWTYIQGWPNTHGHPSQVNNMVPLETDIIWNL